MGHQPGTGAARGGPPAPEGGTRRYRWLLLIAFVEGFASLGIEITALRRLVPHLGSSITITAPTIGLFLVALALGYRSGGRVTGRFLDRVLRNFLLAAGVAGLGLSSWVVGRVFFHPSHDVMLGYLLFMGLVVGPPAYLLAQTVPLISNLVEADRPGAASGQVLSASTLGSVIGASLLPLVLMPQFGVGAAVWACGASLALAVLALRAGRAGAGRRMELPVAAGVMALLTALNLTPGPMLAETAHADYAVVPRPPLLTPGPYTEPVRIFLVNGQWASSLDAAQPPQPSLYVQRFRHQLLEAHGLRGQRILVLGAGGFTLSLDEPGNDYVYVDVDPAIRELAETHFLRRSIQGRFIADDARRHLLETEARYRAIVVDVYSSHTSIPAHLTTLEFWRLLPRALGPDGLVLVNLVLDPRLQSPFARNMLATIEAALGRCAVDVVNPTAAASSNVVLSCQPAPQATAEAPVPYTDERNRVDRDRGLRGY